MAAVKPLVYRADLGHDGPPAPGDTIDPAYLPATAAACPTTLASGATFTVVAGTQVPWSDGINVDGELVIDGSLQGVQ